jgi:tetratricopeptide (TPR) repeat protein
MTILSGANSVPAAGAAAAVLLLSLSATAHAQFGGFDPRNPMSLGWDRVGPPRITHRPERPVSGTISVARLRHKVPSRARREYDKALRAEHKGDSYAAIAHFEKAVGIDPAFMEAYNNLGVRHLLVNQFEQAIAQFQWALSLDGTAPLVHSNLGIAYLAMSRFVEAEKTARQGLKHDSTSNRLRLILGLALDAQRRDPREALGNLEAAAREFPRARLVAARVLARDGKPNRAATELKKYLRSGSAGDRRQVETWLAELEQQLVARNP